MKTWWMNVCQLRPPGRRSSTRGRAAAAASDRRISRCATTRHPTAPPLRVCNPRTRRRLVISITLISMRLNTHCREMERIAGRCYLHFLRICQASPTIAAGVPANPRAFPTILGKTRDLFCLYVTQLTYSSLCYEKFRYRNPFRSKVNWALVVRDILN